MTGNEIEQVIAIVLSVGAAVWLGYYFVFGGDKS